MNSITNKSCKNENFFDNLFIDNATWIWMHLNLAGIRQKDFFWSNIVKESVCIDISWLKFQAES